MRRSARIQGRAPSPDPGQPPIRSEARQGPTTAPPQPGPRHVAASDPPATGTRPRVRQGAPGKDL